MKIPNDIRVLENPLALDNSDGFLGVEGSQFLTCFLERNLKTFPRFQAVLPIVYITSGQNNVAFSQSGCNLKLFDWLFLCSGKIFLLIIYYEKGQSNNQTFTHMREHSLKSDVEKRTKKIKST